VALELSERKGRPLKLKYESSLSSFSEIKTGMPDKNAIISLEACRTMIPLRVRRVNEQIVNIRAMSKAGFILV